MKTILGWVSRRHNRDRHPLLDSGRGPPSRSRHPKKSPLPEGGLPIPSSTGREDPECMQVWVGSQRNRNKRNNSVLSPCVVPVSIRPQNQVTPGTLSLCGKLSGLSLCGKLGNRDSLGRRELGLTGGRKSSVGFLCRVHGSRSTSEGPGMSSKDTRNESVVQPINASVRTNVR